jgi:hypothetical protein
MEGKKTGQLHCPIGTFPGISDVPTIQNNLCIGFPPFDTEIPDQYRVDIFLMEFNQYVTNNNLPSLVYMWLCDDHTSGLSTDFPTPAAQLADNDLALGLRKAYGAKGRLGPAILFCDLCALLRLFLLLHSTPETILSAGHSIVYSNSTTFFSLGLTFIFQVSLPVSLSNSVGLREICP